MKPACVAVLIVAFVAVVTSQYLPANYGSFDDKGQYICPNGSFVWETNGKKVCMKCGYCTIGHARPNNRNTFQPECFRRGKEEYPVSDFYGEYKRMCNGMYIMIPRLAACIFPRNVQMYVNCRDGPFLNKTCDVLCSNAEVEFTCTFEESNYLVHKEIDMDRLCSGKYPHSVMKPLSRPPTETASPERNATKNP